MQVKTKIGLFLGVLFVILIIGIFAGGDFIAIGATSLGIIGAAIADFSLSRKPVGDSVADADRKAVDVEREKRAAVGSMDSVSGRGSELRKSGEQLVQSGNNLVESSKSLIDELRERDKKPI